MSDTIVFPTPIIDLPSADETKFQRERRAFRRLLPQLLQTHPGKYVAIHGERVVDSGDDKLSVALRVFKAHGYVPIYVGLVSEEPQVERVPGFRELSGGAKP
jgi:hypothetical protein